MGVHDRFFALDAQALRAWTQREKRYAVCGVTKITTETGETGAAHVLNVSKNGCLISTFVDLRLGERLELMVEPLGFVEAEVRWSANNEAGLKILSRDSFADTYEFAYPP